MPLVAVNGDPNSHGGGGLKPENPRTVFAEGINVIEHGDPAAPDALCGPIGGTHCSPKTSNGSSTVFVYGNPIHRDKDGRVCGAKTTVKKQTTVFAGG